MISPKTTPLQYFNSRTRRVPSGCLEWNASRNRLGYGVYALHGRRTGAHRFAYEFFVGQIPPGLSVLHNCHNPACVDPSHLRAGTHLDNMKDRKEIGNYDVGANRQISDEMILKVYNSKGSENQVAARLGIARAIVHNIRSGRYYHNITGGIPSPFHRSVSDPNEYAARSFILTSPSGEKIEVTNLTTWCKENSHKFQIKETQCPAWEKIRSGLSAECGYKGWKATRIDN